MRVQKMFGKILCIVLLYFCFSFRIHAQYPVVQISPESKSKMTLGFGKITDFTTRRIVVENTGSQQLTIRVSSDKHWLSPKFISEGGRLEEVGIAAGEQTYLDIAAVAERILVDGLYTGSVFISYYSMGPEVLATVSVELNKVPKTKKMVSAPTHPKPKPPIHKDLIQKPQQRQTIQQSTKDRKDENRFERIITTIRARPYLWIPIIGVGTTLVVLFVAYIIGEIITSRSKRQNPPSITSTLQRLFNKILNPIKTFTQFVQRLKKQVKDFIIELLDDLFQAIVVTFSFLFHLTTLGLTGIISALILVLLVVGVPIGIIFIFIQGVRSILSHFF